MVLSKKRKLYLVVIALIGVSIGSALYVGATLRPTKRLPSPADLAQEYSSKLGELASPSATVASPSASPSPSPSPELTFEERNALYGPCVDAPTLMYHHVEDYGKAKTENHAQLTVDTKAFHSQLQYLKDHNYAVVSMHQLNAFFDQGTPLPHKPVLLTFDDGYEDFGTDAAPLLREYGFTGTLFVPTGLLNNPGYLSWDQLGDLNGQGILLANHTWSHHSMGNDATLDHREISTADQQLTAHGYDADKVFAYPYGPSSGPAIKELQSEGYTLAFTTTHGRILCKQQRLTLPRIRIGNASLSLYGL